MNRSLSAGVAIAVILGITAVAGYWDSRGVIPVGDMRVPSRFVATVLLLFGAAGATAFGDRLRWTSLAKKIGSAMSAQASGESNATTGMSASGTVPRIVPEMPSEAEYLLRCVYHIQVALCDDAECQELLDQIQIKIGRVAAKISRQKKGGVT